MKLPFGWTIDTLVDIAGYIGVGFMALGVGIQYSVTGAIAVFALGLPILAIQRHMRDQLTVNRLIVEAMRLTRQNIEAQMASDTLTRASVADVRQLLKRVAEEGITRD